MNCLILETGRADLTWVEAVFLLRTALLFKLLAGYIVIHYVLGSIPGILNKKINFNSHQMTVED